VVRIRTTAFCGYVKAPVLQGGEGRRRTGRGVFLHQCGVKLHHRILVRVPGARPDPERFLVRLLHV